MCRVAALILAPAVLMAAPKPAVFELQVTQKTATEPDHQEDEVVYPVLYRSDFSSATRSSRSD